VLKLPNDAQMVPDGTAPAEPAEPSKFGDGIDPLRRGPEITELH